VRCAAPGTRERGGPTCGCKKMARRRGPCFRPVIYRELCNCSAWRGYANRNPVRTISAVPALPPLRGVGRDERAGGNLRVSKWESISHFYRNLQAAVRRTCGASPAGRSASKTRVDELTTPRVHPSSPNFATRDGLHRNSGWPELRTVMHRHAPQVG
jgi:hypothetical protein